MKRSRKSLKQTRYATSRPLGNVQKDRETGMQIQPGSSTDKQETNLRRAPYSYMSRHYAMLTTNMATVKALSN